MNRFSYYITTRFITSNKYYNSYCSFDSVYQTYSNLLFLFLRNKHTHKRKKERNSNTKIHQKLYSKVIALYYTQIATRFFTQYCYYYYYY